MAVPVPEGELALQHIINSAQICLTLLELMQLFIKGSKKSNYFYFQIWKSKLHQHEAQKQ